MNLNLLLFTHIYLSLPNFFQLFTTQGKRNEHYIPFIFYLAPNKNTQRHIKVLENLIKSAETLILL